MATTRSAASKSASSKSTASKSSSKSTTSRGSSKSASKSAATKATYKPGQETQKDLKLFVKDSKGKTLGEINVPAGHRVPPTRTKKAQSYEVKA